MEIRKCHCLRCGYRWYPKKPGRPIMCPSCKSRKWNIPKS